MSVSFSLIKRGVWKVCVYSPNSYNTHSETELNGRNVGGANINNLRYVDDPVLIAEYDKELQNIINRVTHRGQDLFVCFVCLFGFLTSSSTTRLYRGRAPRHSVWQFYVLPHMRQSWETMTSVSAGHIILTPTQPVGSGRPQWESNLGPPHQESRALPTKLSRSPPSLWGQGDIKNSKETDFEVTRKQQERFAYPGISKRDTITPVNVSRYLGHYLTFLHWNMSWRCSSENRHRKGHIKSSERNQLKLAHYVFENSTVHDMSIVAWKTHWGKFEIHKLHNVTHYLKTSYV